MKRSAPLRRKKPFSRAPRPLDFCLERNDVVRFRVSLREPWQLASVLTDGRTHVKVETSDLRHYEVPRDNRHLSLPDGAEIGTYQTESRRVAADPAAGLLPPLSAAIVVRPGTAKAVPKRRRRYRSADYLAHVHSLPAADGGAGPIEAHHVNDPALGGDRGVSQKTDDYDTVPLSMEGHAHLTATGCLPGKTRAQTRWTLLLALAATRKAWIVKHEEAGAAAPDPGPADEAEERFAAALDGRGLPRLLAVVGLLLVLLGLAAPARAQARPIALVLGEQALQAKWPAVAWRRCGEAARERGPHRGAALVCQGRAAMLLGWPGEAQRLARAALRTPHYPAAAYVLLGDAIRAEWGTCKPEARTAYLDAAAALPEDPGAAAGLAACAVDVAPLAQGAP